MASSGVGGRKPTELAYAYYNCYVHTPNGPDPYLNSVELSGRSLHLEWAPSYVTASASNNFYNFTSQTVSHLSLAVAGLGSPPSRFLEWMI